MSVQNGERLATKQDLADMYQGILPYLGGMPEIVANKFSKGDLYSTDEKMIGQWIDGKPLYQKVISFQITQTGNTQYPHGIANIENVVRTDMYLNDGFGGTYTMGNISNGTYQLNGYAGKTTVEFNLVNSAFVGKYATAFIQYTKTTDSAISIGSDTDYSTEEKIVGTWIDGSPVYQKVITFPSTVQVAGDTWANTNISVASYNMKMILECWLYDIGRAYPAIGAFSSSYLEVMHFRNGATVTASGAIVKYTKTTT